MVDWERLKETDLREELAIKDLKLNSRTIYGGVSWPGKRPGFAVVLAMHPYKHLDNYDIYLLDEFESFDTRELVRQCGVLNYKYWPKMWVGDYRNDAADRFINEMNDEFELQNRQLSLTSTPILEMERLYQYILPEIKRLLDKERRQLFLRNSRIVSHLSAIQPEEIADLEPGDYPAIEAIAFAVLEMLQRGDDHLYCKAEDVGITDLLSL